MKETPFDTREVLKLWARFAHLDRDRSGSLVLQVCSLQYNLYYPISSSLQSFPIIEVKL